MEFLLAVLVFLVVSTVFAFVHFNTVQKFKGLVGRLEATKDQLERKVSSLGSQVDNLRRTEALLKEQLEVYKNQEKKKAEGRKASFGTAEDAPSPAASGLGMAIDLMLREGVLDQTKLAKAATYKSDTNNELPIEDLLVMLDMIPGDTVETYKQRARAYHNNKQ